jgi:hypothetical protein
MSELTTIKRRSFVVSGIFCALHWVIVALLFAADEVYTWQLDIMKLCGIMTVCTFLLACACGMLENRLVTLAQWSR